MHLAQKLKTLVLTVGFAAILSPVWAQTLTPDAVSEIYQDCVIGCLGSEEATICENLCRCASTGLSEALTMDDYDRLKAQTMSDSGEVDADLLATIQQVGEDCAAELEL